MLCVVFRSQPAGILKHFRVSPMLLQSLRSWHQPTRLIPVHLHTNLHGLDRLAAPSPVSDIIHCSKLSPISSSQSFVTKLALLLSTPQATWSQPHTRKCPTSLLHKENTACHVTISGASGTMLPCFHHNLLCSIATANPNTHALSSSCSGSLHLSLNLARCSLTQVVGITSSLT